MKVLKNILPNLQQIYIQVLKYRIRYKSLMKYFKKYKPLYINSFDQTDKNDYAYSVLSYDDILQKRSRNKYI